MITQKFENKKNNGRERKTNSNYVRFSTTAKSKFRGHNKTKPKRSSNTVKNFTELENNCGFEDLERKTFNISSLTRLTKKAETHTREQIVFETTMEINNGRYQPIKIVYPISFSNLIGASSEISGEERTFSYFPSF